MNPSQTLFVCCTCHNTSTEEKVTPEGTRLLRDIKNLLKNNPEVTVKSVKCLGGCTCGGTPQTGFSAGLTSAGGHSYVFNKLDPENDLWKILEFLRLYRKRPNGRIYCRESPHAEELRPHIATRVPPAHKG